MDDKNYYERLPDNYHQKLKIDVKTDKKLTLKLNLGAVGLLIPLVLLYIFAFMPKEGSFGQLVWYQFLILTIAIIGVLVVHELVHAMFFKLFAHNAKVRFGFNFAFACAGNPDGYYSKDAYYIIGLAPLVLVDLGLIIAMLLVKETAVFFILYVIFALHLSGCVGDIFVTAKLASMPRHTVVHDTGMVMTMFVRKLQKKR